MRRAIPALLLLLPACATRTTSTAAREPASGGFIYHAHQIFVPARINGTPAGLALIDTGASACAIDDDLAAKLGQAPGTPSTVRGTAGEIQARTLELASLSVFGATAPDVATTVYDLGHGATPTGEPLAIIIGYPFLKHFAMDVDYRDRRVTFHSTPFNPGSLERAGAASPISVPMRLSDAPGGEQVGIPVIDLAINDGPPTLFRIDTGASLFDTDDVYLNITRTVAAALGERGQDLRPVKSFSGSGVGGTVTLPVIRLHSARLGSRTIEKPFAITQPAAGVFADPATPGFIANYTLDHLGRVVFDYRGGQLVIP